VKILIVDDEPDIRATLSDVLTTHGHSVVAVGDGDQALAELAKAPETFGLMVTDIQMPKMDGVTLISKVRSQGWSLPVLYTTGGFTTVSPDPALGILGLLEKPNLIEPLLSEIAKLF
jgi:CheY-like chemotaxis protein